MTFHDDMTIDELLQEIIDKKGPFSQDHLTHAGNCIDNASKCAQKIKEKYIRPECRYCRSSKGLTPSEKGGYECTMCKQKTFVEITGIVRHYRVPDSDHMPYRGMLTTVDDTKHNPISLQNLLQDFPDGEAVTIIIKGKGESKIAKDHIWILTKPHTYERRKKGT